jgi:hypothetical protein
MAAPSKTRTSLWSGQSITAATAAPPGGTNSAWIDLSTVYEAQIDIKMTNGGTGPTLGLQVMVQVAANYNAGSPTLPIAYGGNLVGSTVNSDINYFSVTIPIGVAAVRLCAGSNTGQAVTIDADISSVTGVA